MFFNIKDKFRFVTVSLLLGSLVTVISSASADTQIIDFDIDVTECTETGFASWSPSVADVLVNAGDVAATATVTTGFTDGISVCGGTLPVDGTVSASLSISRASIPVTDWNIAVTECSASCAASAALTEIDAGFDVPLDADDGLYSGTFTVNWMQLIP